MIDNGPVIIGGVGGSGTRVVAEMLAQLGYFTGYDLNGASDNLTFTLLFKRPAWTRKNFRVPARFYPGLSILEKSMITGKSLTFSEKIFLWKAVQQMAMHGHNADREGKGKWAFKRKSYIDNPQIPGTGEYRGWGWKEPNSHLFIPVFEDHFPRFKFIHLMRHGLDMAFSSNQQQLFNWAGLFGVKLPKAPSDIARSSLKYWVEAHKRIISLEESLGKEKLLVLNYDELCRDPISGIKNITHFLGIDLAQSEFDKISKLPVIPKSSGRYKLYPEINFDPSDIAFVEKMGFNCAYETMLSR